MEGLYGMSMVEGYDKTMEVYYEFDQPKKEKEWMNCLNI
jgi:hypothetical protein